MNPAAVQLAYLFSCILFIVGFMQLSRPTTAKRGNLLGASGMLLAIVVTLLDKQIVSFEIIIAGLLVGSAVGIFMALTTPMTAMPQMVGLLNGLGGAASALVAGAALIEMLSLGNPLTLQFRIAMAASSLIGTLTLFGSFVAAGKLQGLIEERPIRYKGEQYIKLLVLFVCLFLGYVLTTRPDTLWAYWALLGVSALLGVLVTAPIGGADMPVVVCLMNSYSGLAGASTGFVLSNTALIIAGSLVGASGIILTQIMCKAMNRSLANVLLGGFGELKEDKTLADTIYAGRVKSTDPDETAMLLEAASRVVLVPGYGLAVAQAQYAVRDLYNYLTSLGVEVDFAIHPVAGRMPGHMSVLLAEVDIPYEKLKEMDEINQEFEQVDVAIVVGANDVVNPLANTDPNSPIAGMPILEVYKAKTVVVIKRSLSPGFAGVPNPLFAYDNTLMLFADAKQALQAVLASLKELKA
jgi:NAD(P) transhydrogenase subunit beta